MFFRNECARSSFIIKILEIFPGTGYRNNKVCPAEHTKRLKRKDYWKKALRIIYPYCLTEISRNHDSKVPVRKLFFLELSSDLLDIETKMNI